MMPWFLRDLHRVGEERKALQDLATSVEWLLGHTWLLVGGEMTCDVVIRVNGIDYELRISFPALYPDTPSCVRPLNQPTRVSYHQYGGASGPLCLEWGPDNWHRGVTAAAMLQSAYKLIAAENPGNQGAEPRMDVPSRHSLELGQELRSEWARFYLSPASRDFFTSQSSSVGGFRFSFEKLGEIWRGLIHEAWSVGDNPCSDETIPSGIVPEKSDIRGGVWFKAGCERSALKAAKNVDDLKRVLGTSLDLYLQFDGTSPIDGLNSALPGVLVQDADGEFHLFVVFAKSGSLVFCSTVDSESEGGDKRAPDSALYAGKRIGIVGLGSAGSKIATSLARMGIRDFYLVDFDVLLPENVQRHALDWNSILQHKVNGVADALRRIAAGMKVDVADVHLVGQESNAVVSGVLDRLGKCDVLVDATADSRVFNLLSAVVRSAMRPLVWLEIYGGGLGGVVGRSRPAVDPSPQEMRNVYLQFCLDNPVEAPGRAERNYEVHSASGEILVATDADVTVIAGHAARMIADVLRQPEQSLFPHSLYLIGLQKGWIFDAPFATIPIDAPLLPPSTDDDRVTEETADAASFIVDLIGKVKNETTNPAAN